MPPRGHSSSSHSSRSHSSHSSSHHSSSSHSSRSYSSSRSYGSHSSSSHSSYYSQPVARPRVNQPTGYSHESVNPSRRIYAKHHDYVCYPVPWTDETTGQEFREGYYDENGKWYNKLIYETNGRYENVPCKCEYCGQESFVTLTSETDLPKCPGCGAWLKVNAALEQYTPAPSYKKNGNGPANAYVVGLALFILFLIGAFLWQVVTEELKPAVEQARNGSAYTDDRSSGDTVSNPDIFGNMLCLTIAGDNAFVIDEDGADKVLPWDYGQESYYDFESDCYLWYNTDVSPNLWQYWYEGISSDYGDYGWMEFENGDWYIEESEGNWVLLPSSYDTSDLWHIEDAGKNKSSGADDTGEDELVVATITGIWEYEGYVDECTAYTGREEFVDADYDLDLKPDRVYREWNAEDETALYTIEFGNGDNLEVPAGWETGFPHVQYADLDSDGNSEILFTLSYDTSTDPWSFGDLWLFDKDPDTGLYEEVDLPLVKGKNGAKGLTIEYDAPEENTVSYSIPSCTYSSIASFDEEYLKNWWTTEAFTEDRYIYWATPIAGVDPKIHCLLAPFHRGGLSIGFDLVRENGEYVIANISEETPDFP